MQTHHVPSFTLMNAIAAVLIAFTYIAISSLIKEPARQKFNALIIAGADAVYINGGLGVWEFVFCTAMSLVAYMSLTKYYFIGIGWLMHSTWDAIHHFFANPIIADLPSSSAGCAICDFILAIWFFAGAPSIYSFIKTKSSTVIQA